MLGPEFEASRLQLLGFTDQGMGSVRIVGFSGLGLRTFVIWCIVLGAEIKLIPFKDLSTMP